MFRKFNIRVYGLLINEREEILIADEHRNGYEFTKFPGGGLEWGEGMIDCLKREFLEETELEIEVGELLYCTDYFQQSAFAKNDQLISLYYFVKAKNCHLLETCDTPFQNSIEIETFRWIPLENLTSDLMTFPIDKLVVDKLKKG